MTEKLLHDLDKKNFFYPSITLLAFAEFGIDEIFSRGFFIQKKNLHPEQNEFVNEIKTFNFPPDVEKEIFKTRTFTPLIIVPGFKTKDNLRVYRMDPDLSATQFVSDERGRMDKRIEFTYMTIIAAWEKVRQHNLMDSPVLQFFRHIRNAAAHDGKFHFDSGVIDKSNGELKKEAKWKSLEIKTSLQDLNLIATDKNDKTSFWDQGDLVEFLLDFESHYPELKKN
ncbi:MAG TPA: hypothetical protein VI757_14830 [Bacteroidia bacterium]|nr:hypothetical protein [Bacteroidia bacterium]